MEKTIISTGKTIDAATEAALERLGLDRDSVSVEVLETPRSGFFGIGATPAKIKVTYEAPDEPEQAAPAPALSSASRNVKPSQFERLQAERQPRRKSVPRPNRRPVWQPSSWHSRRSLHSRHNPLPRPPQRPPAASPSRTVPRRAPVPPGTTAAAPAAASATAVRPVPRASRLPRRLRVLSSPCRPIPRPRRAAWRSGLRPISTG